MLDMFFLVNNFCRLRDSKDKNLVLQASHQKTLHAKAVSVGLESPESILRNALDEAKAQLSIQQRKYDCRFQATRSQLLLQNGVDDEDEGAGTDEDDAMDIFEFGEDSIVL